MKQQISYWYGLKHWMLTLFLAPLLFFIFALLLDIVGLRIDLRISDVFPFVIYMFIAGFVLSLPTCLAYAIANIFLIMGNAPFKVVKIILCAVTVIGLLTTWAILTEFDGSLNIIDIVIPFAYTVTIILTGWLLPIQKKRID